jgi:peroxiredoxin
VRYVELNPVRAAIVERAETYRWSSAAEHKVATAYSAWGPVTKQGETRERITRSSFLIDEKGKIEQVTYQVKPEDTVPNALKAVEKKIDKK